jgi:hypothetical protein
MAAEVTRYDAFIKQLEASHLGLQQAALMVSS